MSHLKPDFTAWFVVQGFMAALHKHSSVNDADTQATISLLAPLVIESSKTRFASSIIAKLPYAAQYRLGDFVTNSGRIRHFYLRKKTIESRTRALLDAGKIAQIVVLGAGLDVLSLKLSSRYTNVHFIEVDTSASQRFKVDALKKHQIPLPANVEFIDGDLRNPLADILRQSTLFAKDKPTLWIVEGVFMFIPEDSVTRIFQEIKALSINTANLIFTTLSDMEQTSSSSYFLQNFFLRKENCPFKWVVPFKDIAPFIGKHGFQLTEQIDYKSLHQGYTQGRADKARQGEDIHFAVSNS